MATYQQWKSRYGGMKKDAHMRLRELEKENARMKRAVADLTLDKAILEEIVEGKTCWLPHGLAQGGAIFIL
jgi:hypothetical protein